MRTTETREIQNAQGDVEHAVYCTGCSERIYSADQECWCSLTDDEKEDWKDAAEGDDYLEDCMEGRWSGSREEWELQQECEAEEER